MGWKGSASMRSQPKNSLKGQADRIFTCLLPMFTLGYRYEQPYKPVVVEGVQDNWLAKDKWNLERLAKK